MTKKKIFRIIALPFVLVFLYFVLFLGIEYFYILRPTQGTVIDLKQNQNSAILVIDVQNKLTAAGDEKKAVKLKVPEFLDYINLTLNKLPQTEAIYIRQEFEKNSPLSFILPTFPEEGEEGTQINPVIYRANSKIITKSKADAFSNPGLQKYLQSKKIGTLYITGLAAEACVDSTIRGAIARGYRVIVIKEAVVSMHGGIPGAERLAKYRAYGASVISVNDLK